ncbi:MAG TPA: PKD domain-containing protein, partial [Thermoplasmata archaeon]|nr:PKD domain-containing protein [Thermoplasmata archaeon]
FGRSITHDVVVQTPPNPQPPVASFIANPSRANPGAPIAFDASPSYDPDGTIVWYAWEFGDSTTGTGVSASHVYAAPGTYAVNLTVVDNSSLSDTVSDTVVVNRAPVAAFSYSPTTIYIAVVVTFDGSASTDDVGVVSWTWNFGDGAVGSGSTATHSYVRKGVFLATLTVTDDLGLTDATTRQVRVSNRAPRIIQSDPDLVPVQLGPEKNRSFTVLATDPDADLLTYTWRVDGVVDGGNASILVFSRPEGVYRVNVTISDGSLATWREWTVTVTAPTPGTTGVDVALPWAAGAIFLAAILLALIAAWRRRKRDEVPPVPPQAPPPPPPPP